MTILPGALVGLHVAAGMGDSVWLVRLLGAVEAGIGAVILGSIAYIVLLGLSFKLVLNEAPPDDERARLHALTALLLGAAVYIWLQSARNADAASLEGCLEVYLAESGVPDLRNVDLGPAFDSCVGSHTERDPMYEPYTW